MNKDKVDKNAKRDDKNNGKGRFHGENFNVDSSRTYFVTGSIRFNVVVLSLFILSE